MTLDKPTSDGRMVATPTGSAIEFRLDPGSGVPTYLQLVRQVEDAILLGYLKPGDQLPRVREVVADLAINPNTVLKAYRELEHKGLTSGRPGQGTFVKSGVTPAALPEMAGMRRRLVRWLAEAETVGLDDSEVVALFTTTLRDFAERRRTGSRGAAGEGSTRAGGAA